MTGIADCRWLEPGGKPAAEAIAAFLAEIGIPLRFASLSGTLMAGIDAREGAVWVDPAVAVHPGDLLHEAGHIAVTASELRAGLQKVSDDGGEEMAAMAWSAAAARACGIELDVVFHESGYKGGAQAMRDAFADEAQGPGAPMLQWFGMTAVQGYPAMERWLR